VIRFLLDTNVTSELRKTDHPTTDPAFVDWARSADLNEAAISVMTIHEMERGALLIERRDVAQGAMYRSWIRELLGAFADRLLPLTLKAATRAAAYHVPDPVPLADSLIAATAAEHGLTVVTRNTADFARFDVPMLNPWEPPRP